VISLGEVSRRHDPPLNHNFVVSLLDSSSPLALGASLLGLAGLAPVGGFSECSGLEMAMQPEEYKEGGRNGAVLKFPSRITWTNLTLKKGAGLGHQLWNWHYGFVLGAGRRRDGVITLLDAERKPVFAWFFRRGLPVKYTGPSFNAAQNSVAIEAIEIAHEGIHLVPGFGLGTVLGALAGSVG
jgi:phage tail-like protein